MVAHYKTERGLIKARVDFEELSPHNTHAVTIMVGENDREYMRVQSDCTNGISKPRYYFMCGAEKVYVDDFIHIPFEDINTTNGYLSGDQVALSMMAHGIQNVGVYMEIPCFDYIIPELGFGIVGDRKKMMLCKVTEKSYKVCEGYKIELEPALEIYRKVFPSQRFYLDDFAKMVKSGVVTLVNLNDALSDEEKILSERLVKLNQSEE